MLTGLLYHKPEDHLAFLENCISLAKTEKDIKWNSFLDVSKKPLPPIPKTDGPIKSEAGDEIRTFTTEPEMKQKQPLPPINGTAHPSIDEDDKELTEKNILTSLKQIRSHSWSRYYQSWCGIFELCRQKLAELKLS